MAARRIVVMGPSGVGKSTIGDALAGRLGVSFVDADDLHSDSNRGRMAAGIALTDADRAPWLVEVGDALADATNGMVIACSALRRRYREIICGRAPDVVFVELAGDADLVRKRMVSRTDHFMPTSLLDSQLAILEPLAEDERGIRVDVASLPEQLVEEIVRILAGRF